MSNQTRGRRVRGTPCGCRDEGGKRIENEAEQATVARARELHTDGKSLRAIGRALLAEGKQPRKGKTWHVQVLARVVDQRVGRPG